jgi:hypothetical protein
VLVFAWLGWLVYFAAAVFVLFALCFVSVFCWNIYRGWSDGA